MLMVSQQTACQGHSPLLTCPVDVWTLVLKSLSPADHACLCLVSKNLQEFIEPYLYANIRWAWMSDVQATPIVLLTRSVARRPQLGRHVRSLVLMGTSSHRDVDVVPISMIGNEEFSASLPTELLTARGTSNKAWIDQLHAGNVDALVALLISHLPNLTSLHLGPKFTRDNTYLGLMLRSALCEPAHQCLPRFEHLRAVTLKTGPAPDAARPVRQKNLPNILSFFYLPSIERISTSLDSPEHLTWPAPQGRAPASMGLTELELVRPFVTAHLSNVLSVVHGLKSLRWDWYHGGVTSPSGDNGVIDLDQIAAALSLARESLTEITITAKCTLGANKHFAKPNSQGSLQLLANFPRMRSLQAPIAFLMGWSREDSHWGLSDVVPGTVESVTIMDELWYHHHKYIWREEAVLDVIKAWLADPGKLPPNLRYCRLAMKNTVGLELAPKCDQLKSLGALVGVRVEILTQRRKCSLHWLPSAV